MELPQWVYKRPICPHSTDLSKWIEASKELNCYHNLTSNDPSQQERVYHCLPTSSLNETVEFCGPSILIKQGYCPVYYSPEEPVKPQRCTCLDSTSGFPKDSFYSKEVYKCPLCLKLRNESNCSEAVITGTNPPDSSDNALSPMEIVMTVIIIMIIIFVVLGLVLCYLYCKNNHWKTHTECPEENQLCLFINQSKWDRHGITATYQMQFIQPFRKVSPRIRLGTQWLTVGTENRIAMNDPALFKRLSKRLGGNEYPTIQLKKNSLKLLSKGYATASPSHISP